LFLLVDPFFLDPKLSLGHHPAPQFQKLAQPDSTIQIMTYNLGYLSGMTNNQATQAGQQLFTNNLKKMISRLRENTPDIICFQEIDYESKRSYHLDQHDTIARLFYPWALKVVNWDKRFVPFPYWPPTVWFGQILSGQSIMSQWELSSPTREVLEPVASNPFYYNAYYLNRLLVTATVQHPVKPFLLMDLHAEAFDTLTRNHQLELIYTEFKAKSKTRPVIIAGDFNAAADSKEPGIQLFLNDTTIGCAVRPQSGKPASYPSAQPQERIDYIFYTRRDFEEVTGHVATEYGSISDHLPVIAKLKFAAGKPDISRMTNL
jgi:endonuclease/exonuclease/phosphatase family metal-dependent hydrolase